MTAQPIAPRWGPLTPQSWPQDDFAVPSAGGMWMGHVEAANAQRSRQESFLVSGTFALPQQVNNGQQFSLFLPVDKDGDFWCDQIYMCGWGRGARTVQVTLPLPCLVDITDASNGHSLMWPVGSTPTGFFSSLVLFSDDTGYDPSSSPYPDGFRTTGLLPQPYCFRRGGGIQVMITSTRTFNQANPPVLVDISLGGWKEYEYASR